MASISAPEDFKKKIEGLKKRASGERIFHLIGFKRENGIARTISKQKNKFQKKTEIFFRANTAFAGGQKNMYCDIFLKI